MSNPRPDASGAPVTRRRRAANAGPGSDLYYIRAPSPIADEQSRVLKQGETFAVFDHFGDINPTGLGEEGLYHEGTRFLSYLILHLGADRPLFLSSTVKEDNDVLAVDLTNPDITHEDRVAIPRGTLHIARTKFLWQGKCFECFKVRNYGLAPISTIFALHFEADFADIFEVRGTRRKSRGTYLPAAVAEGSVVLAYRGLDDQVRRTRLDFSPAPKVVEESDVRFDLTLEPRGEATIYLTVACEIGDLAGQPLSYDNAFAGLGNREQPSRVRDCEISTSNEQFNAWLNRSQADLHMMSTQTQEGPYPYAGVPWFSTVFGRDGIITALECLWCKPGLARGVLAHLAATQAAEVNAEQDAEPGKILHESRRGEMAALREIPFGRYYGSVDATPLFVLLAGAYYQRTGDLAFVEEIWPNLERALTWIDTQGDRDGDGLVEYMRRSPTGLVQQGWKDSHDSVFHADGNLAEGPIALCEVQGYVYAARRGAAVLARALGHGDRADQLLRQAQELRERFEKNYWCEELSTYALALDGNKQPCRVRTSNAGHCLYTDIAQPDHARRTAQTLLRDDSFSGWGIRTVSALERRFNPMAYHNGSIWPHDNALIAQGLSRFGQKEAAIQVLTGLFEASRFIDLHRLPELFCGFARRWGEGPTLYPVACSPQAWASASVYLLLEACLGLHIDGREAKIGFHQPSLPEFLKEVRINNLRVGEGAVDLYLQRHPYHVGIHVLHKKGPVEVAVFI